MFITISSFICDNGTLYYEQSYCNATPSVGPLTPLYVYSAVMVVETSYIGTSLLKYDLWYDYFKQNSGCSVYVNIYAYIYLYFYMHIFILNVNTNMT